jgi:8-oxo-dGTP pyrophosphatase MutT (NUDIX family)
MPVGHVSAALAFAFQGEKLLLVKLKSRGWDLPGGHLEPGEQPEYALRREVFEEAGATLGDAIFFGYQWIRLLSPPPQGYPYPLEGGYQVFFVAEVASLGKLTENAESVGARMFSPAEVRSLPRAFELFDRALTLARAWPQVLHEGIDAVLDLV